MIPRYPMPDATVNNLMRDLLGAINYSDERPILLRHDNLRQMVLQIMKDINASRT